MQIQRKKHCPQSGLVIKTFSFAYVSCKTVDFVLGPFFFFAFPFLKQIIHWNENRSFVCCIKKLNAFAFTTNVQIEFYVSDAKTLFRKTARLLFVNVNIFDLYHFSRREMKSENLYSKDSLPFFLHLFNLVSNQSI